MHINIIIPTRARWDALQKTLESLKQSTYKDISIHIVLDKNPGNIPEWLSKSDIDLIISNSSDNLVSCIGSYTSRCTEGAFLVGGDDLIFYPDCLEQAVKSMQQHFPERIGIIGINQYIDGKPGGLRGAFALMNRKFIDHFPNRILYCPDYVHYYADTEIVQFAKSINGFYFCKAAKLDHLRLMDKVGRMTSQRVPGDKAMYEKRRAKGYLWGKNFDLIGRS